MIVFNATFGGEQRVGPAFNQRNFAVLNPRKTGCARVLLNVFQRRDMSSISIVPQTQPGISRTCLKQNMPFRIRSSD